MLPIPLRINLQDWGRFLVNWFGANCSRPRQTGGSCQDTSSGRRASSARAACELSARRKLHGDVVNECLMRKVKCLTRRRDPGVNSASRVLRGISDICQPVTRNKEEEGGGASMLLCFLRICGRHLFFNRLICWIIGSLLLLRLFQVHDAIRRFFKTGMKRIR